MYKRQDQGVVDSLQDNVEKRLAVFNHRRYRISGVCQASSFQFEVFGDLLQYLIRTFPLENIGVLVFLQIPGLIVSRDLNLFLFVLADFYDVAIKQSGFIV